MNVLLVYLAGLCTNESLNQMSNFLLPAPLNLERTYLPESDRSLCAGWQVPEPGASVVDLQNLCEDLGFQFLDPELLNLLAQYFPSGFSYCVKLWAPGPGTIRWVVFSQRSSFVIGLIVHRGVSLQRYSSQFPGPGNFIRSNSM